jgi:hypothetical protein
MPHTARDRLSSFAPAHVTLRLAPDLVSLRTKSVLRAVERSFASGSERASFRLVHYSLLSDHAHLIVEAGDHAALGRGMMAIGSRLALAVNRVTGRHSGRVGAERYHARLLRSPLEARGALRYVLLNARKRVGKAAAALRAAVLLDPADVPG